MSSAVLAFFVSALYLQTISAQYIGHSAPGIFANNYATEAALANGRPYAAYGMAPEVAITNIIPESGTAFNGGGFKVTSYSSASPTGIKVQSDDLVIEGPLAVNGQMPFLGVVALEGSLPAVGEGAVAYGCGDGNVGIVSEGAGNGFSVSAGLTGLGYNGVPNGMSVRTHY